jgi:enoyl-CoA hydratase/carnithine racemase
MIDYQLCDQVGQISLDRASALNAFTAEGWDELIDALERAEEEARVAVIQGRGNAFCVGEDIEWLASLEDPADIAEFAETVYAGFRAIETARVPVVAAVDGPAYGVGVDLVGAAHLAVATSEARFTLPETRLGAYPGYGLERYPFQCTRKQFMELALTGEPIDATTALEWGLLNRVVDPGALDAAVDDLVGSLLKSPRRPLAVVTGLSGRTLPNPGEHERMMGLFTSLFLAPEFQEGVEAFREKRDPEWQR